MQKILLRLGQFGLPIALLAWLCVDLHSSGALATGVDRDRSWACLLLAVLCVLVATCLSFLRWHILLRILAISVRWTDTFRLGFLGYLLSFVTLGNVGGDLFKAVFIAREQPSRKAEAIATVLLDRVCGMFALLVVATMALLATGVAGKGPELAVIAGGTYACTAAGGLVCGALLVPWDRRGICSQRLGCLPWIGGMFGRLGASLRLYRSHKLGLMLVAVTALAVHLLIGVAVYFAARGLFDTVPTLGEHLVISPLSSVAGALPVAPAGLGQYEVAMNYLFEKLPVSAMPKGMGFLVALWYRAATIFVAAIGIVFYWVHRREVRRVWQQAKQRDFLDA